MRIQKTSNNMKFLIATLLALAVMLTVFGVSKIFAEPTIYDLVEQEDIGGFVPKVTHTRKKSFSGQNYTNQ